MQNRQSPKEEEKQIETREALQTSSKKKKAKRGRPPKRKTDEKKTERKEDVKRQASAKKKARGRGKKKGRGRGRGRGRGKEGKGKSLGLEVRNDVEVNEEKTVEENGETGKVKEKEVVLENKGKSIEIEDFGNEVNEKLKEEKEKLKEVCEEKEIEFEEQKEEEKKKKGETISTIMKYFVTTKLTEKKSEPIQIEKKGDLKEGKGQKEEVKKVEAELEPKEVQESHKIGKEGQEKLKSQNMNSEKKEKILIEESKQSKEKEKEEGKEIELEEKEKEKLEEEIQTEDIQEEIKPEKISEMIQNKELETNENENNSSKEKDKESFKGDPSGEEKEEDSAREESLHKRSISISRSKEPHENSQIESTFEANESNEKLKEFYWKFYPTKEGSVIRYITGGTLDGRSKPSTSSVNYNLVQMGDKEELTGRCSGRCGDSE